MAVQADWMALAPSPFAHALSSPTIVPERVEGLLDLPAEEIQPGGQAGPNVRNGGEEFEARAGLRILVDDEEHGGGVVEAHHRVFQDTGVGRVIAVEVQRGAHHRLHVALHAGDHIVVLALGVERPELVVDVGSVEDVDGALHALVRILEREEGLLEDRPLVAPLPVAADLGERLGQAGPQIQRVDAGDRVVVPARAGFGMGSVLDGVTVRREAAVGGQFGERREMIDPQVGQFASSSARQRDGYVLDQLPSPLRLQGREERAPGCHAQALLQGLLQPIATAVNLRQQSASPADRPSARSRSPCQLPSESSSRVSHAFGLPVPARRRICTCAWLGSAGCRATSPLAGQSVVEV